MWWWVVGFVAIVGAIVICLTLVFRDIQYDPAEIDGDEMEDETW